MRFGGANSAYAIHRAVWSGDGDTFEQAINYTNAALLHSLRAVAPRMGALRVADLGCGIGGSLFYLAAHWGAELHGLGLTISKTQAELAQANERALAHGEASLMFVQADYSHLPAADGAFDAACAIESFCHAPDPARFFDEASRALRPGGRLVLCDDFIARAIETPELSSEDAYWLRAYIDGWRVPHLVTFAKTTGLAAKHDLRVIEHADLTPRLRLRAVPRRAARLMISAARPFTRAHDIVSSMIGSTALQLCLKRGLVEYKFVVFEKC